MPMLSFLFLGKQSTGDVGLGPRTVPVLSFFALHDVHDTPKSIMKVRVLILAITRFWLLSLCFLFYPFMMFMILFDTPMEKKKVQKNFFFAA